MLTRVSYRIQLMPVNSTIAITLVNDGDLGRAEDALVVWPKSGSVAQLAECTWSVGVEVVCLGVLSSCGAADPVLEERRHGGHADEYYAEGGFEDGAECCWRPVPGGRAVSIPHKCFFFRLTEQVLTR